MILIALLLLVAKGHFRVKEKSIKKPKKTDSFHFEEKIQGFPSILICGSIEKLLCLKIAQEIDTNSRNESNFSKDGPVWAELAIHFSFESQTCKNPTFIQNNDFISIEFFFSGSRN